MFFDYQELLELLRDNPNKSHHITDYETAVGRLGEKPLTQEKWYAELVKPFNSTNHYLVPSEFKNDFDWHLFSQLGASSLSSEIGFEQKYSKTHLLIKVNSNCNTLIKKLHELGGLQILQLFEIWAEENINLCTYCYQDDKERMEIHKSKNRKLEIWNYRMNKLQESFKVSNE